MTDHLKQLCDQISEQVAVQIFELPNPADGGDEVARLDAACRACGLEPIGAKWREITANIAEAFIRYHIAHDLAYSADELVDVETASHWASEICQQHSPARWFTSHGAEGFPNTGYGWTPLTKWTFDVGYARLGTDATLLIVFQAED